LLTQGPHESADPHGSIQLAWATDRGLRREDNEDSVLVWRERAGVEALLLVADGIGGQAAGHVASKLAVEAFASALEQDGRRGSSLERLRNALAMSNAAVLNTSRRESDAAGMGTTLAAVVINSRELGLVNVGDSSVYLFRGDSIQRLSEDHSWPAELARRGSISDEEVQGHGMKHMLAKALGQSEEVEGYGHLMSLDPGDLVVLCTDGVEAANVTVEEVRECLASDDLAAGVQRIIASCLRRGAPDNVSLIAARLEL
jgi:serine/threonine protein phosphatase PrpC